MTVFEASGAPGESYPTVTWAFDSNGRVLTESRSSRASKWTCHYDGQGQVARAVMTREGKPPERVITFTRGDGWRSEHFRTAVASILTKHWLDGSGRVIRSVERDELQRYDRLTTEIRYTPDGREECSDDVVSSRCTRATVDAHGNETERVPPAATTARRTAGNTMPSATGWCA